MQVTDILGNPYGVGDRIVYATTVANSAWLKQGHVVSIHEKTTTRYKRVDGERIEYAHSEPVVGVLGDGSERTAYPTVRNILAQVEPKYGEGT